MIVGPREAEAIVTMRERLGVPERLAEKPAHDVERRDGAGRAARFVDDDELVNVGGGERPAGLDDRGALEDGGRRRAHVSSAIPPDEVPQGDDAERAFSRVEDGHGGEPVIEDGFERRGGRLLRSNGEELSVHDVADGALHAFTTASVEPTRIRARARGSELRNAVARRGVIAHESFCAQPRRARAVTSRSQNGMP